MTYKRGTNPRSLANLRPSWLPGESGNAGGHRSPLITPAMRRYAAWTATELVELAADESRASKLPMADVIAITMLLKAARDLAGGDRAREFVTERLDGPLSRAEVDVAVGVQVIVREVHGSGTRELG